jgi:hypothetical protein
MADIALRFGESPWIVAKLDLGTGLEKLLERRRARTRALSRHLAGRGSHSANVEPCAYSLQSQTRTQQSRRVLLNANITPSSSMMISLPSGISYGTFVAPGCGPTTS